MRPGRGPGRGRRDAGARPGARPAHGDGHRRRAEHPVPARPRRSGRGVARMAGLRTPAERGGAPAGRDGDEARDSPRGRRPAAPGADGGAGPDFVEQGAAPAVLEAAPARAGGRPPVRPSGPRPGRYDAARGGPRRDPAGRSLARHRGHLGAPAARSVGQLALAPRLRRGPRPGRDADRGHRPSVRADRGGAAVPRAAGRARAVCLPGLVHERPAAPPPGRVVHHGGGVPGRGSVVRAGLVVAGEAARDGPRRPPVPPRAPYGPRTGGRAAPGATLDGRPGPGAARVDAGRRTASRGRTADALTASRHDPADPAFWAGLVVVGR